MKESQYIQHVRQMVRDFNASDQQRKTEEEQAQQTYRVECEAAEAELRRQQHILNTSKAEAKTRQDTVQQAANTKLNNARNDAASKLANAKEAQKKALGALERVSLQTNVSNSSFQKPSTANLSPLTELAKAATTATETAGKIQQEIWDLECLRREAAERLQRQRALRQKLLLAAGMTALILVVIIGSMINRALKSKPHYLAAVAAIESKDWEKARNELNQLFSIDINYKDAQSLFRESYYRPAKLAFESQHFEIVQTNAKALIVIDSNYKDIQMLLRESYYQPAKIAFDEEQWEAVLSPVKELIAIDPQYKDGQTLLREAYYQIVILAMNTKQWQMAQNEAKALVGIDSNYKDTQILLRETYYQPAMLAFKAKQWKQTRQLLGELMTIDANYKDTQVTWGAAVDKEIFETVGLEFVSIPAGCFRMGSQTYLNDPVHEVCVDGFGMGKYEVTQAQWQKIMGNNPSHFKGDNYPVEQVSWDDVQAFIAKLNQLVGKRIYRLPTEAEWEYAARAGTQTAYSFGDNPNKLGEYAWYQDNSGEKTHPVGQLKPNDWGLYDMYGNVSEWCEDIYSDDAYNQHQHHNPIYHGEGSSWVKRGGAWYFNDMPSQSAYRESSGFSDDQTGFRLVRMP